MKITPTRKTLIQAATLAALVGVNAAAQAATVVLDGATVTFTFDDTLLGNYFLPTVNAGTDTLRFEPEDFLARDQVADAATVSILQTVNISVAAKPGFTLSSASLFESGSYYRFQEAGFGGSSLVAVNGDFIVDGASHLFHSDDFPLSAIVTEFQSIAVTTWDANPSSQALLASVGIRNELTASITVNGDEAFIELLAVELSVATSPVPLPAPALLLGSGLLGLLGVKRRKAA